MGDYVWLAPLVAFLIAAIGWLLRELHFRRDIKRQATAGAAVFRGEVGIVVRNLD